MAAGKSGGSAGEITFLEALARSESKRDGGFKNNWSFDHGDESEGDTDKDEANLLSVGEDEDSETSKGKKLNRQSEIVSTSSGDPWKTCARRNKADSLKPLKGNPIGLNMLSNNKKLSENVQNASICSGTVVHGRRFQHANVQTSLVKTAAQSSLDQKERKEYPPHVQKFENNSVRLSRPQGVDRVTKKIEESESHLESEIKRKVPQKRHSSTYQSLSPLSPASKKCLTDIEDVQRNCRQAITLSESTGPLLRTSIHQNSGGQKSQNTALSSKKFYGNSLGKIPVDIIVNCDDSRQNYLQTNGKVILPRAKVAKLTNLKERKTSLSDLNDPIILSSDDDDDDNDRTNRRESISPQPADSACSSPAPSTGKVEAALNENICRVEHELRSIPADSELNTVTLPRKARMKDQFGNSIVNTPLKRRKVTSQETLVDPVSLSCQSSFDSVILNCRSIRVGTLFRLLIEPVIFCLDFIKIQLEEPENDPVGITLNTSDLTKCEWCNVRKLPVVFLQTIPAVYQKLSMQLQMNMEDKVWNDSKGINKLTNLEEQYIILIFQNGLDPQANMVFESIITDIGIKNNVSNFFAKIPFEEANSRLVACTRTYEESIKGSCGQKENKIKNVSLESKIQLKNKQEFQFFDDEEETGENHTIFMGPVEKYLVLEKLKKEEADRIHIFSSFFYKRLNQRERRNLHETTNLSIQQKRHGRVKTWTRHVDIFEKDFIFVPLNEAAHWFLAVVCFPGLEKPKYEPNPHYHENTVMQKCSTVEDSCISSPSASEMDSSQNSSAKPVIKKMLNKKHCIAGIDSSAEQEESDPHSRRNIGSMKCSLKKINHTASENEEPNKGESTCQKVVDRIKSENGLQNEYLNSMHHTDGLSKIRLNYSDESAEGSKMLEDELIDFSEDQDNQDDSSDDGFLADDNCNSEIGQWHLKPTICKQPCILLMDSLRGPSRSNVVKILREYLEVEWEVKKGSKRSFSKDVMKGSNPKVPQQNNFSDCGVYVLQYVESFFENPILNFELPMNLANWFPPPRMRTKREEIRNIILKLQEDQSKEKKKLKDTYSAETSLGEGTEQYVNSISD
ncbi:sentrin-specific protease 6 isoform X4 [Panthera pardus]|uniref:Sentrin-specific protease 6 isoform X4 n=3 Tax=Felidae TaxID=9681 RepID=A0ABM3Q3M9_ACIJB|nr:sentrin-specific protease 6 isoform X4 [Puma yagouaroundi]XP_053078536.1 sentrin-specific protease 6 isoform X4 [Acinonyx jubatus]XP_053760687.1 sentrin-specific protease 6 isoform X4 [Panthera pardus]XP_060471967.1 sentrin-specific protease 6 isoform X4 [Panthera onca]